MLLDTLPTDESDIGVYLSRQAIARIITYWLLGYEKRLAELLHIARTFLELSRDDDGNFLNHGTNLQLALVAAADGKAERLVRRFFRKAAGDATELALSRADSCQILGMAHAIAAAVDCIREALIEPSLAFPFLEPFLPYYDSIRGEPAFVELLREIEETTRSTAIALDY